MCAIRHVRPRRAKAPVRSETPFTVPQDVLDLVRPARMGWQTLQAALDASGVLQATRTTGRELLDPTPPAALAAVPGTAETVLWGAAYGSLAQGILRPPQAYKVTCIGTVTGGATPGTLVLTPRVGTTTGGVTLGATAALTLLTATSIPFIIELMVQFRAAGAAGTAYGLMSYMTTTALIAAPAHIGFNVPVAATINTDAAQGLTVTATFNNAGSSFTPQILWFESLN